MHRSERSHLEEWATLLEVEVSDELLEELSETWDESSTDRRL